MVELSDEQAKKIDAAFDSIIEIRTVLLGAKGEDGGGLCNDVKDLETQTSTLNRNFWILVALLVGSGVIGGSIWAALGH